MSNRFVERVNPAINVVGPPGPAGPAGPAGINAFTTTTAPLAVPLVGSSVTVQLATTAWVGVGQVIYIDGAGYYSVVSVDSGVQLTILNLGYPGNAVPPYVAPIASHVGPGGLQGPAGPNYFNVTQANTFVGGEAVYFDGTTWLLAQANSGLTLGLGLVQNPTATDFEVVYVGPITGIATAYAPMVAGNYYFLSTTSAGQLTATAPTLAGTHSQPILFATSTTGGLVLQYRPSENTAPSAATARFGNVAVVDAVNGNDGTASVNGLPFLTVNAAVTAIGLLGSPGTVWILPGTYNVTPFTIPAGCALRGMNTQTCVIRIANAAVNTTLVTMGDNTRIEDLSLSLASSNTVDLTGVEFPGTTAQTAKIRTCVITVNNAGVAVAATTNVYGIRLSGSNPATSRSFSFNFIRGTTVNVLSNGAGNTVGIYMDGSAQASTRDTNVYVAQPTDLTSAGLYVGVWANDVSGLGTLQLRTTTVGGPGYVGSTNRAPVRVLALTNVTLTGPQTVDGITLNNGDRVLCTGQTTGTENGIWVVNTAPLGAWSRGADMGVGSNANRAWVPVSEGTYAGQAWLCTAGYNAPGSPVVTGPFVVGTSVLTFQYSSSGYDYKIPARAVERVASLALNGAATVDGVALATGDRVLATAQVAAVDNGIYVVNTAGAWTRALDLPTNANPQDAYVIVTGGTTYKHTAWQCSTGGTVGTTAQTWNRAYFGADILQEYPSYGNTTAGLQVGPGVELMSQLAGGAPFSSFVSPTVLTYGLKGNMPNGTEYLWPGVQAQSDNKEQFYRIQQDTLAFGLSVNARTAPNAVTCSAQVNKSWSGLEGTGVPTPLTISWTDGVLQQQNYNVSIKMSRGNYISLGVTGSNTVNNIDMTVEVDLFG